MQSQDGIHPRAGRKIAVSLRKWEKTLFFSKKRKKFSPKSSKTQFFYNYVN